MTTTHTLTTGWYVFRANATHLPPLEGRFSLAETAAEAADAWEADGYATEVAYVNVAEVDTTDYSDDDDEQHPDDEPSVATPLDPSCWAEDDGYICTLTPHSPNHPHNADGLHTWT